MPIASAPVAPRVLFGGMDGEFIATSQQTKQERGGNLEYRFA